MRLKEYLNKHRIKQTHFALKINVPCSVISKIVNHINTPSMKTLQKIIIATGGEVTLADFIMDETEQQAS